MTYYTRAQAAKRLGLGNTTAIDRLRFDGVLTKAGVLYLQDFKVGRRVRIPERTIEGNSFDRLGLDDLVEALVRDAHPVSRKFLIPVHMRPPGNR